MSRQKPFVNSLNVKREIFLVSVNKDQNRILFLTTIATIFALSLASAETNSKPAARESFHIAQSDAEKILLDIIRRANTDNNIIKYILGRPRYDAKKDTGYSYLFTKTLLQVMAKKESDLVKRSCGGKYTGKICGIDYNPITCSQDFIDEGYLFQTKEDNGHKAVIHFLWTPFIDDGSTFYILIKDGAHWKLDGINCGNGAKFNMD